MWIGQGNSTASDPDRENQLDRPQSLVYVRYVGTGKQTRRPTGESPAAQRGRPASEAVAGPLTDEQARLVRENVGLVAVHLRTCRVRPRGNRKEREWDDLFQEGCLGLIRAARGYRGSRGIPFAAYALMRIRQAVSEAIFAKSSLMRLPVGHRRSDAARSRRLASSRISTVRFESLDAIHAESIGEEDDAAMEDAPRAKAAMHEELTGCVCATDWHSPMNDRFDEPGTRCFAADDTVGARVRGRLSRATRTAMEAACERWCPRDDRRALAARIVEERLMVPDEDQRVPLRRIARETASSIARVMQAEQGMRRRMKKMLEADDALQALWQHARSDPRGVDAPMTPALHARLNRAEGVECLRRMNELAGAAGDTMLSLVLAMDRERMVNVLAELCGRIPVEERDALFNPPRRVKRRRPTGIEDEGRAGSRSSVRSRERRRDPRETERSVDRDSARLLESRER